MSLFGASTAMSMSGCGSFRGPALNSKEQKPLRGIAVTVFITVAYYMWQCTEHRYGLFPVAGQLCEVAGLCFVILEFSRAKNAVASDKVGVSIDTVGLITIARAVRASSHLRFDLDTMVSVFPQEYQEDQLIIPVDILGLILGMVALFTRGERRLQGNWFFGLCSAALFLTLIIPPGFFLFDETYSKERWMFGFYLECLSMLPQVVRMIKGGVVQSTTAHFVALNILAAFFGMIFCSGIAGAMDGNLRSAEWWTMSRDSYCGMLFLFSAMARLCMMLDFGLQYIQFIGNHCLSGPWR